MDSQTGGTVLSDCRTIAEPSGEQTREICVLNMRGKDVGKYAPFSGHGDSGAQVYTLTGKTVGPMFAGNEISCSYAPAYT